MKTWIALLPIALNALSYETRGKLESFSQLIAHGELLLIATAIIAAAIGELFNSGSDLRIYKTFAGGSAIIILIIASSYFADISAGYLSGIELQTDTIEFMSLVIFGGAVISGGICIILSEY